MSGVPASFLGASVPHTCVVGSPRLVPTCGRAGGALGRVPVSRTPRGSLMLVQLTPMMRALEDAVTRGIT